MSQQIRNKSITEAILDPDIFLPIHVKGGQIVFFSSNLILLRYPKDDVPEIWQTKFPLVLYHVRHDMSLWKKS